MITATESQMQRLMKWRFKVKEKNEDIPYGETWYNPENDEIKQWNGNQWVCKLDTLASIEALRFRLNLLIKSIVDAIRGIFYAN
jgi:hypothetical protein